MYKVILYLSIISLVFSGFAFAAVGDFIEGMPQDEFAMLLVQELELEDMLPTSAVISDYFNLLREMGIEPADGWDIDGVISRDDILHMLGLSEDETAGMDFSALMAKLIDRLSDILWARTGTRPAVSPFVQ